MMPNEFFSNMLITYIVNHGPVAGKGERISFMLPSIFDRGKLTTNGLCCSLSHLPVHTEMTGNTIERQTKLLYEKLKLMWLSFGSYKNLKCLK